MVLEDGDVTVMYYPTVCEMLVDCTNDTYYNRCRRLYEYRKSVKLIVLVPAPSDGQSNKRKHR